MVRCRLRHSSLATGAGTEYYLSASVSGALHFQGAIVALQDAYRQYARDLGLDADSEIWVRFFLSDISTQSAPLSELWTASPSAFLCPIGQAPADGTYVSLLAGHIRPGPVKELAPSGLLFRHGGYASLLSLCLPDSGNGAELQTDEVIDAFIGELTTRKASLSGDVVRTWYYMRDVDNNYAPMIASRRRHYEANGLTPETHFIASTGIEAQAARPGALSWMTALTTMGLLPGQVRHLKALSHLSPTHAYGVNFERATATAFGDREHIHLSGTASIDGSGQVLHLGDVAGQLERTMENIAALLDEGGMGLGDLLYAIIYLRDPAELPRLAPSFADLFKDLPLALVRGAVCRPEWLIEIEGLAGAARDNPAFAPYL